VLEVPGGSGEEVPVTDLAIVLGAAGLLFADTIFGRLPDPREELGFWRAVTHPVTTTHRRLRRWSYRRCLRRSGRGAERAFVWEPKPSAADSSVQLDLYHATFDTTPYDGSEEPDGRIQVSESGVYYIDNLSGYQRRLLRETQEAASTRRATREWWRTTGDHLDYWRDDLDNQG
jgi:hypothetical protein